MYFSNFELKRKRRGYLFLLNCFLKSHIDTNLEAWKCITNWHTKCGDDKSLRMGLVIDGL